MDEFSNRPRRSWFLQGCLVEASLLGVAWVGAWLTGRPPLADAHWRLADVFVAIVAAGPPLLAFQWTLNSRAPAFVRIREFLDRALVPLMREWALWQLAVISVIAGVAEEALFRGFVQGWLQTHLGAVAAVILASLAFGLAHPITLGYAVVVGIIGIYLGLLWELTGNLLVPIITHGLYDFVALIWYLRVRPQRTARE